MKSNEELVYEVDEIPEVGASKEPVLKRSMAVTAATGIVVILLETVFKTTVSEEVQEAIYVVLAIVAPYVLARWVRPNVWSPDSVKRLANTLEDGDYPQL